MFGPIISDLKNGILPDNNLLRQRFEAALIKKMGVIRTPYSFWPADTKINPHAKQLLWAAILLQDKEKFEIVRAIISSELEEKQRAKGQRENMQSLTAKVHQLLQEYILEFIALAPDDIFQNKLHKLTQVMVSF
ncbi:MAG: hypothetical protein JRF05_04945 [Deltaproteobacteria bacterium]|jgi:hypothetical protein|nr:hypothetical protein [Deltaproteobacteria bacterium]